VEFTENLSIYVKSWKVFVAADVSVLPRTLLSMILAQTDPIMGFFSGPLGEAL